MPAGSKIEASLIEALGDKFESKDNEKRSARLKRIVKAVSQHVSDEQYTALPKAAQEWYTAALESHKAGSAIADFSDAPAEEEEPTEKKASKKKSSKKATTKTKGESKKGERKARETGPSAKSELIKLRLRKLNADLGQLLKDLKEKGYTMSEQTAAVLDGHTRAVVRVATEIQWKPKDKE